jgi:pimeloyl-ACP methyl ester carboxylesterase
MNYKYFPLTFLALLLLATPPLTTAKGVNNANVAIAPVALSYHTADAIFIAAGATLYKSDLPSAEIRLLDTGHFALETHGAEIAHLIREFLGKHLKP